MIPEAYFVNEVVMKFNSKIFLLSFLVIIGAVSASAQVVPENEAETIRKFPANCEVANRILTIAGKLAKDNELIFVISSLEITKISSLSLAA